MQTTGSEFKTRQPKSTNTAGDAVRGNWKVMQSESSRELPSEELPNLGHGRSQGRKRVVLTANEPRHVHTVLCATKPPRNKTRTPRRSISHLHRAKSTDREI